jgi:hypothetical protein
VTYTGLDPRGRGHITLCDRCLAEGRRQADITVLSVQPLPWQSLEEVKAERDTFAELNRQLAGEDK